ncbi:uncharacterized protein LOC115345234 isoform X3 [Aquila chrysaetos chrysaetos]|uniref:uncharacterized protein LOC115345234 isoform X3 n=1 Tax=Aquila chrysaetos chrysaetos TaxID=223781 RepID=UPI001B7D4664|nr:uncharacterized protein LOC115345234 isoform X3 [Aquila chrysaetos chrysaetos]
MLKKKTQKAIRLAAASHCRQERPCLSACGRIPLHSPQQVRPSTCTTGWRTVKQQDLQERKGGEKEKETSELAKASGSAESKSCGGCQLPPFHCGCPFFCRESTRQMERFRSGLQVQALFTKRARCKAAAAAAQGL